MEIQWIGFLWTILAAMLAIFLYRMTGNKGAI